MRKIILFIATGLDGYIARLDGGMDWLFTDAGYRDAFLSSKTHQQVLTFGDFSKTMTGKKNNVARIGKVVLGSNSSRNIRQDEGAVSSFMFGMNELFKPIRLEHPADARF